MAASHDKKVSIIVPCYRVEDYLPRCLDSLVTQTLPDVEIICINDGSPDRCIDILREYEARYPDTVVVIDKPNEGVWRGRRDGIARARGAYIGFVDSDDYVLPTFAEALYTAAVAHDADIAVCGFNRVDLDTGADLTTEMTAARPAFSIADDPGRLLELNGAPWNKLFRAELLKNLDDLPFPPPILDDLLFHLLVFKRAQGTVAFVPQALVKYVIRPGSIITSIKMEQVDATFASFESVQRLYQQAGASEAAQDMLAGMAFLHLGISLLFRLSYDPSCAIGDYVRRCTAFLDRVFPRWRSCPYLTFRYCWKAKGALLKLWIVRRLYGLHLMAPFMAVYRFCVDTLRIDIKW